MTSNFFNSMLSKNGTKTSLIQLIKQADDTYTEYLKKMKTLENSARELLAKAEAQKRVAVRNKIRKLK